MRITFDPLKRNKALAERGLDFMDAAIVFEGTILEAEDIRRACGEKQIICFGHLAGRLIVVGYTPRGADRHGYRVFNGWRDNRKCDNRGVDERWHAGCCVGAVPGT